MSAEITNSLSCLSHLQVMAGSTVARYKARQDDPQGVGRELQVDVVLTGGVAEHGNKLDVDAELLRRPGEKCAFSAVKVGTVALEFGMHASARGIA